jgi:competence protein ComEA
VEQSSTPWRVFDAPAGGDAGADSPPARPAAVATAGNAANPRLALAAVAGALAIGVVAVALAISGTGDAAVVGPTGSAEGAVAGGRLLVGGDIVVDVTGAVSKPGLYRLAPGARVGDAIGAAGGFSPRVDVERVGRELNLAATIADGAHVQVPSRDDPVGGGAAGASPAAGGGGSSGGQLVNLNTATEAELDALSGIGPVTAGKIIESRAGAPFKTVDELRERGLVGEKTFEKIRAQLTVG